MAQEFNQEAIDELCERFKPLVLKEAHKTFVQDNLGEDAVNTAWEIFLETILYTDFDFRKNIPSYLKKTLHLKLVRSIIRDSNPKDCTELDSLTEDVAEEHDAYNEINNKLTAQQLLEKLPPYQKEILVKRYFEGNLSYKAISFRSKNSYVYNLHTALKLLRKSHAKEIL